MMCYDCVLWINVNDVLWLSVVDVSERAMVVCCGLK